MNVRRVIARLRVTKVGSNIHSACRLFFPCASSSPSRLHRSRACSSSSPTPRWSAAAWTSWPSTRCGAPPGTVLTPSRMHWRFAWRPSKPPTSCSGCATSCTAPSASATRPRCRGCRATANRCGEREHHQTEYEIFQ